MKEAAKTEKPHASSGVSWASNMRRAPWGKAGALALTVLAHLVLLLGVGRHGSVATVQPRPAPVALMVSLVPEPAAPANSAEPVLPLPALPSPDREAVAAPEPSNEPGQAGTPEQFFPLQELTSPPEVAGGLARDQSLELAGTTGGYITVRFWINALGEVVRAQVVAVDDNEDDEEILLAALRQVRFLPARIGRKAVSSEMQMELRVVRNAGL